MMDKDRSVTASSNRAIWDCGSSLYDSFELKSLLRQLDSAVAARCHSMPHLAATPPPPQRALKSGLRSKFSRSLKKLIRSVFGPKPGWTQALDRAAGDGAGSSRSGCLPSIPEGIGGEGSPERRFKRVVGKVISERFASEAAAAKRARSMSYGDILFVQ